MTFIVANLGTNKLILGHDWLIEHNPTVDWSSGQVIMNRCPFSCGVRLHRPGPPQNNIKIGKTIKSEEPRKTLQDYKNDKTSKTIISSVLPKDYEEGDKLIETSIRAAESISMRLIEKPAW